MKFKDITDNFLLNEDLGEEDCSDEFGSFEFLWTKAVENIDLFFKDKEMYFGGPIPQDLLKSDDNILLLFENISDCLIKLFDIPTKDIIDVIDELHGLKIPKYFIGGIMILYFRYCCGSEL